MTKQRTEADIERERIEWVFGLTGGELESERWDVWTPYLWTDGTTDPRPEMSASGFAYWYEGCPDYCERAERQSWEETQARTVVVSGGGYLSPADPWMADPSGVWVRVAVYQSSGETECPGRHEDAGPQVRPEQCGEDGRCVLCEALLLTAENYRAAQGSHEDGNHGYIYVGEGYEAVYILAVHRCEDCGEDMHCRKVESFADGSCGCPIFCAACLDAAHVEALEDEDIRREAEDGQ